MVRNDDRSLSWREFLLVQEAEQYMEDQRIGLSAEEYFLGQFAPKWSLTRLFKYLLIFIATFLFAAGLACLPSFYVAKHLLKMEKEPLSTVMKVHPMFMTKVTKLLICNKYPLSIILISGMPCWYGNHFTGGMPSWPMYLFEKILQATFLPESL